MWWMEYEETKMVEFWNHLITVGSNSFVNINIFGLLECRCRCCWCCSGWWWWWWWWRDRGFSTNFLIFLKKMRQRNIESPHDFIHYNLEVTNIFLNNSFINWSGVINYNFFLVSIRQRRREGTFTEKKTNFQSTPPLTASISSVCSIPVPGRGPARPPDSLLKHLPTRNSKCKLKLFKCLG